jgi:hypothetical protein
LKFITELVYTIVKVISLFVLHCFYKLTEAANKSNRIVQGRTLRLFFIAADLNQVGKEKIVGDNTNKGKQIQNKFCMTTSKR